MLLLVCFLLLAAPVFTTGLSNDGMKTSSAPASFWHRKPREDVIIHKYPRKKLVGHRKTLESVPVNISISGYVVRATRDFVKTFIEGKPGPSYKGQSLFLLKSKVLILEEGYTPGFKPKPVVVQELYRVSNSSEWRDGGEFKMPIYITGTVFKAKFGSG